jgi:hypothetical protein
VPRYNVRRRFRPAHVVTAAVLTTALLVGTQFAAAGASKSAAKAAAKKHLLVLSDMPTGWKAVKGSSGGGSNNFPGAKQLAGCIGVAPKLIGSNPPEVDSPTFEDTDDSHEVQDSISLFGSAKVAKAEFGAMSNTKTPACMTTLMNGTFKNKIAASAGSGTTIGDISVTRASPATFAQGATGFSITIPFTTQGQSLSVNILVAYAIKGSLGQEINFNANGSAFPTALSKSLTATALGRL